MAIRAHRDEKIRADKLKRLDEPHIAPLTALARRIQKAHPGVPFFDPKNGGIDSKVLFLLEAPGPQAVDFVSQENDDQSAENIHQLMDEACLPPSDVVFWNVVPFYIGAENRAMIRAARARDLDAGRPWLIELLDLLPQLKVVVLLGRKAQRARKLVKELRPDVCTIIGWHPSPRAINRVPSRRQDLQNVFQDVKNKISKY